MAQRWGTLSHPRQGDQAAGSSDSGGSDFPFLNENAFCTATLLGP